MSGHTGARPGAVAAAVRKFTSVPPPQAFLQPSSLTRSPSRFVSAEALSQQLLVSQSGAGAGLAQAASSLPTVRNTNTGLCGVGVNLIKGRNLSVVVHARIAALSRPAGDLAGDVLSLPEAVEATWRAADAVCFDVDSTVCEEEGIDELARFCGAGEKVAEWTTRAMSGSIPFEQALESRLQLINPSEQQLKEYLALNPPRLSPGINELVSTLHARNCHVYLISGGFRNMIYPVASLLGVPANRVIANTLLFNPDGSFAGHDPNELTSRSGGKARAVQHLRQTHGYKCMVMVGDGATDLEARYPPESTVAEGQPVQVAPAGAECTRGVDLFIGYGGVHVREKVKQAADLFVYDFKALTAALQEDKA